MSIVFYIASSFFLFLSFPFLSFPFLSFACFAFAVPSLLSISFLLFSPANPLPFRPHPHPPARRDAGAQFLISPVVIPEVITWCQQHNIVCVPGCQTPTEAYTAYKLGAPIQKIFPGVAGGHMWCKVSCSPAVLSQKNGGRKEAARAGPRDQFNVSAGFVSPHLLQVLTPPSLPSLV